MRNSLKRQCNTVALFTTSGYDLISTAVISTAVFLQRCGYQVDLFTIASDKFAPPEFLEPSIRCIAFKQRHQFYFPGMGQIRSLWFYAQASHGRKHRFLVGFDPGGLRNAALLGMLWQIPFVYHSLEIVCEDTLTTRRQRLAKWIDRMLSARALLTLTQDKARADILVRENHLPREKIAVVPNAALGEPMPEKSRWLRDKFGIEDSKVIVLATGSLIPEHMIEEIVRSVPTWPSQFVLMAHGWFADPGFEEHIRGLVGNCDGRVYLSTELLPASQKYLVFQSADIGLALYRPVNDNFRYVGAAAGKVFDFCRCGIPVIANDLPGFDRLIKHKGCGEVVRDCSEIGPALVQVAIFRERYSRSAIETFLEYEFSRNYEPVLRRIETAAYKKR